MCKKSVFATIIIICVFSCGLTNKTPKRQLTKKQLAILLEFQKFDDSLCFCYFNEQINNNLLKDMIDSANSILQSSIIADNNNFKKSLKNFKINSSNIRNVDVQDFDFLICSETDSCDAELFVSNPIFSDDGKSFLIFEFLRAKRSSIFSENITNYYVHSEDSVSRQWKLGFGKIHWKIINRVKQ